MRQIVLDTETTGISPAQGHRIIEIGCLELVNRKITGNTFHVYINPERAVEPGAFAVHGLGNDFLADKPRFVDIYADFLAFIHSDPLIIHNAPFDVGFLNHELALLKPKQAGVDTCCDIIDTLAMARKKHPGQKNNLDALCRRYHVDNSNRDLHGALLDAELLAGVYLQMTGGQEQLFSDQNDHDDAAPQHAMLESAHSTTEHTQFVVVQATAAEQAAHQQWLDLHQQPLE